MRIGWNVVHVSHPNENPGELRMFFTFFSLYHYLQLLSFLEPTLEGVVLLTFGSGNIPSHRQDLLDVLRNAVGRGVTLVNVSQCVKGSVSFSYETGKV